MTRFIALIAPILICCCTALAEDTLSLRFLAQSVPADLGQVSCVAAGKVVGTFDLPMNQLSGTITVRERVIAIVAKKDGSQLAKIDLPPVGSEFVLLLIPDDAGSYDSVAIRMDDGSFPAGNILFCNRTGKPITGHVGTSEFTVEAGGNKTLRPSGERDGTYDVEIRVREETKERLLRSMRWPVQARNRSYLFFFVNPENERIDFRAVDEFVVPAAPKG